MKVKKTPSIQCEITVPGDKSISHRAVILAGLSNGTCVITGFPAQRRLPLHGERDASFGNRNRAARPNHADREWPGKAAVRADRGHYCGNSGTTMRLLSGVLSTQTFRSRLVGDPSLSKRPMKRIIEPLSKMGAKITAEGRGNTPRF